MSPDMCPDMICNVDAEETFVSLEYTQDDINKEYAYSKELWDFEEKIEIKLRLRRDCPHIFGYAYGRINYKKSIKFWSKVRSRCKKELKRLNDRGINGKGNLCRLTPEQYMTYANYHNQYLNAEDMTHQARFYRNDKHRYNTYMIPVTIDLSE